MASDGSSAVNERDEGRESISPILAERTQEGVARRVDAVQRDEREGAMREDFVVITGARRIHELIKRGDGTRSF